MQDIADLRRFILDSIDGTLDTPRPVTGETALIGADAVMSSLSLVSLLLQVEDYCREYGLSFSWTTDAAMSPVNSPFRTVDALVEHIAQSTREKGTP